jgi:hypothetical protein
LIGAFLGAAFLDGFFTAAFGGLVVLFVLVVLFALVDFAVALVRFLGADAFLGAAVSLVADLFLFRDGAAGS